MYYHDQRDDLPVCDTGEKTYTLKILDENREALRTHRMVALSDEDAIDFANAICGGSPAEVWHEERLVYEISI